MCGAAPHSFSCVFSVSFLIVVGREPEPSSAASLYGTNSLLKCLLPRDSRKTKPIDLLTILSLTYSDVSQLPGFWVGKQSLCSHTGGLLHVRRCLFGTFYS
uniref:Uncharacterized protein n=1 Tax=Sphaerodactylus townsendi TaxID=933632 RepID=A0ACB8E638_9SAUR